MLIPIQWDTPIAFLYVSEWETYAAAPIHIDVQMGKVALPAVKHNCGRGCLIIDSVLHLLREEFFVLVLSRPDNP